MTNALLFATTVLIWGTSWIAIVWQIGPVPVMQSVFYRFLLAGALLVLALALSGRLPRPPVWRFVVLQAVCLFSLNYLCFYTAAGMIPSGVASVIFSLASIFNAVNARIWFGEPVGRNVILAALVGLTGVVLLLWRDLAVDLNLQTLTGIGWAVLGTILFSLGNMASRANSARGITPLVANGWGMPIGALLLGMTILTTGQSLVAPTGQLYWSALIYLAIFGSIVGFTSYLMLVQRIGSARAGYATVLFPVVALSLSAVFEDYDWTVWSTAGLLLTGLGNVILFRRPRA